jgi:hypothetical protein
VIRRKDRLDDLRRERRQRPDSALLIPSASANSVTGVQTQALNSFVGSGWELVPADPHRNHWRRMPQLAKLADHPSKRGLRQTSDARMPSLSNGFDKLAHWTARHAGRPATFALALAIIVVWGVSGPIFQWSDTWQLIINTGTTIVTFLMVFLIQNTQNRDTEALQLCSGPQL